MLYYVYVEGRSVGPLPIEELKPLVESGAVNGDTLAWTEALERWQSARTITALAASFPSFAAAPAAAASSPKAAEKGMPALGEFGVRFLAGAIDAALVLLPFAVVQIGRGEAPPGETRSLFLPGMDAVGWVLSAVSAVYFLGLMSRLGGGRTLGYRVMKLRLVSRTDFQPPPFFAVFVWYLATFLSIIGFLWYFFDRQRRMLHNVVSDTLVVTTERIKG